MAHLKCERCGREHGSGFNPYEFRVSIRSTFDGVIPDDEDYYADEALWKILSDQTGPEEEEAPRQVFDEAVFLVCRDCKRKLMSIIREELNENRGRINSENLKLN
jgi:hypothetical protein